MAETKAIRVTIDPKGRVVLPAALRHRLGIESGDVLVARAEDNRLVLERRDAVLARLRRRFSVVPAGVSLADELIAERRAEARREGASGPSA
jgi:AbrB family looped-hinge helix DNA binding protein